MTIDTRPPVAPVDATSERFKVAIAAYAAASHGAQGEFVPPLYYAIKAWERNKTEAMQAAASGEVERLRAALQKLCDGLAWDWRGHPVGDLPTLREIAQAALKEETP